MMPAEERRLPTVEERLSTLLHHVGERGLCRGCQARIWWVMHRNGTRAPYVAEGPNVGLNHFVDCPAAKEFQRKKS